MTWNGHYKNWGVFPDGNDTYRKVMLHYTMGCASTGCSGWDYTTHILLRHRTGMYDSTQVFSSPSFTIGGYTIDSLAYSLSPTYIVIFDSLSVDTIYNDTLIVVDFNDPNDPLATDTSYVFGANYYNYQYDSTGAVIDSNWVADNTIYTKAPTTYNVFEIIEEYELEDPSHHMAPTCKHGSNGYNPNWNHVFSYDITDFAYLLKDSVEIDAFYSGWSSGFGVTTDFEFIEGVPARNVLKVSNILKQVRLHIPILLHQILKPTRCRLKPLLR